MARRTKADAQATRASLLDAAERLFQTQGVSRTSLSDIAQEAGTTRGAIYWHFKDKADLFNAMMDRVTQPLEEAMNQADVENTQDPVAAVRDAIVRALTTIGRDPQTCRVLQIATHRVEYVQELCAVQERHLSVHAQSLARIQSGLERGYALRGVAPAAPVATCALGLQVLVEGLLHQWLLQPGSFDLVATARSVCDLYLAGIGLGTVAPPLKAPPRPPGTSGQ